MRIIFCSIILAMSLFTSLGVCDSLRPRESLPASARDEDIQNILNEISGELPSSAQKLIKRGTLGISVAELIPGSKERRWASINGKSSLCAASTLKIVCALAAFEAEARGLVEISDSKPTSTNPSHLTDKVYINSEDIKSSILYHKPGHATAGNRDAGKVCKAVNDAFILRQGGKPNSSSYSQCFVNSLLKEWGFHDDGPEGMWLGLQYGSKTRCNVPPKQRIWLTHTNHTTSHKSGPKLSVDGY